MQLALLQQRQTVLTRTSVVTAVKGLKLQTGPTGRDVKEARLLKEHLVNRTEGRGQEDKTMMLVQNRVEWRGVVEGIMCYRQKKKQNLRFLFIYFL